MHVFGWWEEAGVPEKTHAYTGRTCKLHTERPQPVVEPGTLCCEATVLTTTPPCSPFSQSNGSISNLVAVQVTLNIATRWHVRKIVLYKCLILTISL